MLPKLHLFLELIHFCYFRDLVYSLQDLYHFCICLLSVLPVGIWPCGPFLVMLLCKATSDGQSCVCSFIEAADGIFLCSAPYLLCYTDRVGAMAELRSGGNFSEE